MAHWCWRSLLGFSLVFLQNRAASEATDGTAGTLSREKRSVLNLYQMVTCAMRCDPISFKDYGCYCGFMGSGTPVDGLDRCCQEHDYCYGRAKVCLPGEHYLAHYRFLCNYGKPICVERNSSKKLAGRCGQDLCYCDVSFVKCIKQYGCPSSKALCKDVPWRNFSNKFTAALTKTKTHSYL